MSIEKRSLVLLVTNERRLFENVNACLKQCGPDVGPFWEVLSCPPADLPQHAGPHQPEVLFLDLDSLQGDLVELVGEIAQVFDKAEVVCSKMRLEVPDMLDLLKAGVKNFLTRASLQKDLEDYLKKFKGVSRAPDLPYKEETARGKILAVFGPKGGSGITLLSANLAASLLSLSGQRAIVCDLSGDCGDVTSYLNLRPSYTVRDVLNHADLMDNSFLEGTLVKHASGLEVLAAPREEQEMVSSSDFTGLQRMFSCFRTMVGHVVIDLGGRDFPLIQAVLSQVDMAIMVGSLDVLSMRGMVSYFNKLKKFHFPADKVIVVINRFNAKNQLDIIRDFEKHTGKTVTFRLPNHYPLCIQALNEGKLLEEVHRGSVLGKGIGDIARAVCAPSETGPSAPKTNPALSFLKRLGA
ncbi:MAG: hypothetical protein KTQ49_05500 [Candidatus Omnitrophica bacterium]|nr:hypothetical protein [Candidatus Omnitrophota bacterium]